MRLLDALEARARGLFSELAKFGTVGLISFVVDLAVFNAVLHVLDKPLTAKIISTVFSATNAFLQTRSGVRRGGPCPVRHRGSLPSGLPSIR